MRLNLWFCCIHWCRRTFSETCWNECDGSIEKHRKHSVKSWSRVIICFTHNIIYPLSNQVPDLSILFVFVWISQHAVVSGDNQGTTSNDTLTSEMIRESRFPDGFGEAIRILKRMYIQYIKPTRHPSCIMPDLVLLGPYLVSRFVFLSFFSVQESIISLFYFMLCAGDQI